MLMEKYYHTETSVKGYNPESNSYDEYVSDTEYVEILRENQSAKNQTETD